MKILFNLLLFTIFTLTGYTQTTNQYSDFSVPTHKCEFSNKASGEELYKGHNYNYYLEKSIKAKNARSAGWLLTGLGFGSGVFGMISNSDPLIVFGWVGLVAGVSISIPASYIYKNNKKALEQFEQHKLSFEIKSTKHGMGLVINF